MAVCFNVLRRQLSTTIKQANVFKHVTVIGGGLMGSGIAQVTAQGGMDVTVVEINEESVQKCDANIKSSMQRVAKKLFQNSAAEAEKYLAETMGRLKFSTDIQEAVAKSDLVIEAIVENLGIKQKLFTQIDSIAPEHAIFASNTSSIPIKEIASATNRKAQFGGLHFFNPVPVMKLLEIVRTDELSDESYQKLLAWGKAIGKTCITCKDTPGFVVNRLLVPYLAEAIRMLEKNIASAKDIDIAMKLGAGYPMGPLELLDYVGLDTTKFILDGWHKKEPENPLFSPIPTLEKLVSEGKLGKKTGEGFYSYKKINGPFPIPLYCPYIQPLIERLPQPVPVEPIRLDPPPEVENVEHPPEPIKPVKMVKAEKVENEEKLERLEKLVKMERAGRLETADKPKKLAQRHFTTPTKLQGRAKIMEILALESVKDDMILRLRKPNKMPKNIEEYLRDSVRQAKKMKMRRTFMGH